MRSSIVIWPLGLLAFAAVLSEQAAADGGAMRLVERQRGYEIAVFTDPTPPRVGLLDVSVLLRDAEGRMASDAQVVVTFTPADDPLATVRATATAEAATNKLLRSALVELPQGGTWRVEIECLVAEATLRTAFELEVLPAAPRWFAVWPWFSWPAVAVALFGVHRWLVWRKT